MALTTFTAGTGIQSTPVNNNFQEVKKIQTLQFKLTSNAGDATTTSFTTLITNNLTAAGLNFRSYGFLYNIWVMPINNSGEARLLITFEDDSTDTITLLTSSSRYSQSQGSYYNTTDKKIKNIQWQGKVNFVGGGNYVRFEYLVINLTSQSLDGRSTINFIGYNGY